MDAVYFVAERAQIGIFTRTKKWSYGESVHVLRGNLHLISTYTKS